MSAVQPGPPGGPTYPPWHLLWIIAGWALFAWLWWLVLRRPWQADGLRQLLLWTSILFPAVTLAWIAHNRNIYRRLGPRRGLRPVPLHYLSDFNGRQVDADWAALQPVQEVAIEIDGDRKRYRAIAPPEDAR